MESRRNALQLLFVIAAAAAPALTNTLPPGIVSFKQPERWACDAWTQCAKSATPLCDVKAELSRFPGASPSSPLVVSALTQLRLTLVTAASDGTPCSSGGASFRVWLETASRLLPGYALDHWNGTYTLVVPVGRDKGTYQLHVVLDFTGCEGSALCSTQKTLRQRLAALPMPPSVVVTQATGEQLSNQPPSGRWIRDSKQSLHWSPGDEQLAPFMAGGGLDALVLRGLLANRWIHVVGMSMTGVFRTSLLAALQAAGFKDAHGYIFRDTADDRDRMFGAFKPAGADRICAEMVDRSWHFFPSFGFLLTEETDSNGMIWDFERYKGRGDGGAFDYDLHLSCVDSTLTAGGGPPLPPDLRAAGPDVVVYNHGIHSAHLLNSAASLAVLRRYQSAHFGEFTKRLAKQGTTLVFRNSAPTHFSGNVMLPSNWMCRTPTRLACINEVSYDALGEMASASYDWRVLDFWTLGLLRPDCTPDNRHYKAGNCAAELCRVFLGSLKGWMDAVADARAPFRANVTRGLAVARARIIDRGPY
jgi:hypothetical protein